MSSVPVLPFREFIILVLRKRERKGKKKRKKYNTVYYVMTN